MSLIPNNLYRNELDRLCQIKSWTLVEQRLNLMPAEASPSLRALQGEDTTILAMAIRKKAPFTTIQSLIEVDLTQLRVVQKTRGTILHEAFEQNLSLKLIRYLLHTIKSRNFEHILNSKNNLKRTVLHCLILRSIRARDCPGMIWTIFKELIMMCPAAVRSIDCDGNTPLLLFLLNQETYPNHQIYNAEDQTYKMVKLMVCVCPEVVALCQKPEISGTSQTVSDKVSGNGKPTALTYAMLYNRSEELIKLLLDVSKKNGNDPCMTLVSSHHELPLHMAVTLRCSISLLKKIIEMRPEATLVYDTCQLLPLDWLWIRFVLDWYSDSMPISVSPSTRRYLPKNICSLHQSASEVKWNHPLENLQKDLWQKMKLLIHMMTITSCDETQCKQGEAWSMLHAVCSVKCPLPMVRLALEQTERRELLTRDLRMGRLPLHYAARRHGYQSRLFVGPRFKDINIISEPSPVSEILEYCTYAARISDANDQLPLHILIEALTYSGKEDLKTISLLLAQYPASIECRDGKSKLYPFMQAALGNKECLDLSFFLLLQNPTLISSALI